MERHTLVLTSWFFPHQVLHWEDAVRQIYLGSATVVAEYDEEIRSPSVTWKMPAVIRLRRDPNRRKRGLKFSRFNVYTRDGFACQYCGEKRPTRELTFDHVVPRVRGGPTTWENITTSCKPCNSRKGRRTCDKSGMFPLSWPRRPHSLPIVSPVRDLDRAPIEWVPFLQPYVA